MRHARESSMNVAKASRIHTQQDAEVVKVAAEALSNDIRMVLGQRSNGTRQMIIAGTLGRSKYIDRLAKKGWSSFDDHLFF